MTAAPSVPGGGAEEEAAAPLMVKVVGTLARAEKPVSAGVTPPDTGGRGSAAQAASGTDPSEHPLVKRAGELFGRKIDGAR